MRESKEISPGRAVGAVADQRGGYLVRRYITQRAIENRVEERDDAEGWGSGAARRLGCYVFKSVPSQHPLAT